MSASGSRPVSVLLTSHWLSLTGVVLVTTAGLSWLFAIPAQARGHVDNPYVGIILYLILPVVFFAGLALIPIGAALSRRRIASGLAQAPDRSQAFRRLVLFLGVTTAANVVIGSQLVYRAVDHMETPQFCGQSCHVMQPQAVAHQRGAHKNVACVECHVAPGAAGWVRSKINGTRQLYEVTTKSFHTPIPAGLTSGRMVSSEGTCQHCHAPAAGPASQLVAIPTFAEDEANTATWTVLTMHVDAIHSSHLAPGKTIRFAATDATRATIPWVEVESGGKKTKYVDGSQQSAVDSQQVHTMECLDCHNRPAHTFELPARAVDRLLAAGELPATLPSFKKHAMEVLQATSADEDAARKGITDGLAAAYGEAKPEAASKLIDIWRSNVFPDLKVTWGTYPSHLGHTDTPGCFRCHGGEHAAADGKAIEGDCALCHEVVATDEAKPAVLQTLAGKPGSWRP